MARTPKNTKHREREQKVRAMFHQLHRAWGPQHWWPAESAFEMIVGAYLTQNTAWTNVELALARLRAANALSIDGIRRTPIAELEELVRPAGYFRQKAARLKQFVAHLDANYAVKRLRLSQKKDLGVPHPYRVVSDRVGAARSVCAEEIGTPQHERDERALAAMLSRPSDELRAELLALNGVGPETADSILLYAGLHPIFVVDAYTKRIFSRHALISEDAKYEDIRVLVETALRNEKCGDIVTSCETEPDKGAFRPPVHAPSTLSQISRTETAQVFAEFHGLLVQVGKHFCLKQQPRCDKCPLRDSLPNTRKRVL
jgi:endonuclease-3 related protein